MHDAVDSLANLPQQNIAILGLGLMGGSLAYALSGKCNALIGVDPDPHACHLAQISGIFTEVRACPAEIDTTIDVWILAAPVRAILHILADMTDWTGHQGIVLDIGSTKTQIVAAMRNLPDRFDPLGGHPMCGKETGSFASAEASLFKEAPFAFCSLERSSRRAIAFANELTGVLGAHPIWLPAAVHDRWVAATSHLPYLVANALAVATPLESAPMVGPGFRSSTRVSGSSPEMMLDILLTNQEQILVAAMRFQDAFQNLITLLEANGDPDYDRLSQQLQIGRQQRIALLELEEKS